MVRLAEQVDDDDDAYNEGGGGSQDEDKDYYPQLAYTSSHSMTFVAIYTTLLSLALNFYGSTAIIGFTNMRGEYMPPCFSGGTVQMPGQHRMKVGIFGGALVLFANLLVLCAVIFGEFQVVDYMDEKDKEDIPSYAVERISRVLAVAFMFLAVIYLLFAGMLCIYHSSISDRAEDVDYEEEYNNGDDKDQSLVRHCSPIPGTEGYLSPQNNNSDDFSSSATGESYDL
eukprot:CAMPEP_0198292738 /NCGR_PEP_ID=MMETSP1449-20131203/13828_1 /TAXON_ID=420275 /ORGANISM="Attheya septentrionalis, Strain CCMP2084" /LENGTH=226 /DNA_ID=CAMNT_0043992017 /DNA_START=747 /DNA_END=1427 /DNA_ORIENTATION=+